MMEVGDMKSILRYLEQLDAGEDQRKVVSYIHDLLDKEEFCYEASDSDSESEWQISSPAEVQANMNDSPSHESVMRSLQCLISKSPLLTAYQLQPNELMLIARICQKTKANCEQDFYVREICEMLPGIDDNLDKQYAVIVDLIDREILSTPHLMGVDYHYDLRALYGTGLRLNGLLWNLILGKDPIKTGLKAFGKGLAKPNATMDAILKMIGVLFMHYPELTDDFSTNNGACYGRNVDMVLDSYLHALINAKGAPRWMELCKKHRLNSFWQKCLLLIDYFNRETASQVSPATLASLLARNAKERKHFIDMLAKDNQLSRKGLIEPHFPIFAVYMMELTSNAITALHGETEVAAEESGKVDRSLSNSTYLTRIDPTQALEQLILDQPTREMIVTIVQRLRNPQRDGFAEWGLMGASLTGDKDVQQGINILLHGVPGTGKTFIAGVIANELKRPLIQINANAIRGSLYGESEKQARELFQEMRAAVKRLSPVFLLNEGDQLIHQRIKSPERSADHAENTIQSVFLEELESFPGILIITTNLADNLDLAMSRRLHYKLEIKAPDYQARKELWRMHLPESIPGASDIAVESLAKDFPFTGGQIRLVVQNACHEVYLRGKTAKVILADLRKYAILESGSNFETTRRAIGFAL
jgi:AAA+ superfamily predicted ATPase